jgi:hypothetical protein
LASSRHIQNTNTHLHHINDEFVEPKITNICAFTVLIMHRTTQLIEQPM